MKLDLILTGADIVTMDPQRPRATRVGILGGRIVGLDEGLEGATARETLDVRGASIVPGFNDVHCHTTWFGLTLAALDVTARPGGIPEIYTAIEEFSATLGPEEWINATGFAHRDYGGEYPRIEELDRITGGRPLFIRQTSGHAAIVNTEALRRAGILEPGFTDPPGGVVVRDASGRPTGLVEETAQGLVQDLIRPYSVQTVVDSIDRATAVYAREGITSFGEAGVGGGWIGHSPIEIAAYQRARERGVLRARAQLLPAIDALHALPGHRDDGVGTGLDLGIRTGFGDDMLNLGGTKVFMDGALSGETAALFENYSTSDHPGYFQDDLSELRRKMFDAYASGWSLAVHAIGDRAIDAAITAITEAQERWGRRAVPNRIEHAALVQDSFLPRLAAAGIVVTPQAAFADGIGDGMNASVGPARRNSLYRAKSFLAAGVPVAGSSDRPCADGSALRGIQAFVDRRTRAGEVMGGAAECLSPGEALSLYTVEAARASGHGHLKGRVRPGMLADLAILDANPLSVDASEIAAIPVRATLLGGEFTHGG